MSSAESYGKPEKQAIKRLFLEMVTLRHIRHFALEETLIPAASILA